MNTNTKTTPSLVLRCAIPLRSASHGIRIAQALNSLYRGVSDVVSVADRKVVLSNAEISRIELSHDAP